MKTKTTLKMFVFIIFKSEKKLSVKTAVSETTQISGRNFIKSTGPGCSKLTMSLVNVSLKFQSLISEICQYFLLKKSGKLVHFFNKKYDIVTI